MLNKLYYNLFEKIYRSKLARHAISFLYRLYLFRERSIIQNFIKDNNKKAIIAINASEIYHFNHIKMLYKTLINDESYTVILIGSNPKKICRPEYQKFIQENDLNQNKNLFSYIWLPILKPDIFIESAITPYHRLCHSKTLKVLFAHGLSSLGFSKNHAHITKTVTYDYILSTGPYQKKTLELAANQYSVRLPEIIPGGFIRGDILMKNAVHFNRHNFNITCGFSSKKTVLFAPTWGEFSATRDWINPIADLCEELDFNLLIKLHPLMLSGKTHWETAGIDWPEKLKLFSKNKNIHICNQLELADYMLGADIMITDASSVGIEYMFLQRPVIFLPAPKFFQLFGRDKPIFWVRNGLEVNDIKELKEKLAKIFSEPDFTPDYDLSDISFHPGHTIENISHWIKNLAVISENSQER